VTEMAEEVADDAWRRAFVLMASCTDRELLNVELPATEILYRLFHEDGVRVPKPQGVQAKCRCSRERIMRMLRQFPPEDRRDMVGDDGRVRITCEFCSRVYDLDPAEVEAEVAQATSGPA